MKPPRPPDMAAGSSVPGHGGGPQLHATQVFDARMICAAMDAGLLSEHGSKRLGLINTLID